MVGRLTGVFGVRGEIKCIPTALGENAFATGKLFALGAAPHVREVRCASARRHHEKLLLGFEGVATPEAARELVGAEIFGEAGEIVLGKDEYLDADLIGLRLIDPAGGDLGTVASVRHFPAQDCLVVGERGALVPMVKAFIKRVDLVARTIDVELPEGLLEG